MVVILTPIVLMVVGIPGYSNLLRFFLRSYWDDPYSQALFATATQQQDVLRRHVAGAPVEKNRGLQRSNGTIPWVF